MFKVKIFSAENVRDLSKMVNIWLEENKDIVEPVSVSISTQPFIEFATVLYKEAE